MENPIKTDDLVDFTPIFGNTHVLRKCVCFRHMTYTRMKKKAINRLEKAKNAHDWGESHEDKDSEASVARFLGREINR